MKARGDAGERSFTLIELLVAIAIIGVLAGIVLAVAVHVRGRARGTSCMNQMRQIGMVLGMKAERGIGGGWAERMDAWSGHKPLLLCPEGPQDGLTNYAVNSGLANRPAVADDSGSVVLLYESKRAGTMMTGDARDVDERHVGGANYVYLDGHAKWSKEVPEFGP